MLQSYNKNASSWQRRKRTIIKMHFFTLEQNTDLKKVIVIATGGFVFGQIIFLLICVIIRRKG